MATTETVYPGHPILAYRTNTILPDGPEQYAPIIVLESKGHLHVTGPAGCCVCGTNENLAMLILNIHAGTLILHRCYDHWHEVEEAVVPYLHKGVLSPIVPS